MLDVRETWARAWPPLLAVGVVSAVGAPAAVASYRHARDVVSSTGDTVMSPWLPLSVDGMLVAALVVIWVRRRRGQPAGFGPWAAFAFGMAVTIAANLAAVEQPSPTAVAVALFPPLALGITLELVALVAYRPTAQAHTGRRVMAVAASAGPSGVAGTGHTVPDPGSELSRTLSGDSTEKGTQIVSTPGGDEGYTAAGTPAPGLNRVQPGPTHDDLLRSQDQGGGPDRAAALIAEGAGRRRLARELGITEHAARELLDGRRNGHEVTR